KARENFSDTYREMSKAISRVSEPSFTLYDRVCIWLYEKIHGRFISIEDQRLEEIILSIKGIKRIIFILKPLPAKSKNQKELVSFIQSNYDKRK
ncbi:MAG: hypothetical protein KDK45_25615, partial [Leptospiraceae bacterium]|nr:hypothetical protein [Leptospiraceae bacterium]